MFGYPMEPFAQILADTPAKFKTQTHDIIPDSTFIDDTFNHNMSRASGLLIFVSYTHPIVALYQLGGVLYLHQRLDPSLPYSH